MFIKASAWLNELDHEYKLTTEEYGMGDFINELKEKGYIRPDGDAEGGMGPTSKLEIGLQAKRVWTTFSAIWKKAKTGQHNTGTIGRGD